MLVARSRHVAHGAYFERRLAVAVNIMSFMGPVWAPIFSQHHAYEVLTPFQNLLGFRRYIGVSKNEKRRPNCADDAGLKQSAPNPPQPGGTPQKHVQKTP